MNFESKRAQGEPTGFGVDFGSRMIKIVKMGEEIEGWSVRAAGMIPTPVDCMKEGVITDKWRAAAAIRKFCKSQGIKPVRGRFSVPAGQTVVRWLELPPIAKEDFDEVARFQARKHLQRSVDSDYVTLTPLHLRSSAPSRLQYLLVALPKEVVDSRAETLEMAGIEPIHAALEPYALLRGLHDIVTEKGLFWRDQSLTFMEMGDSSIEMYVVRDLELRFVRSIPFGSNRMTQVIAEALRVEPDAAEQIKEDSQAKLRPDGILAANGQDRTIEIDLSSELERLVKEVRRLIKYYRSLFPERSYAGILDRVYLCGGMASLRGLDQFMGQSLNVYVQAVNPFSQAIAKFHAGAFQSVRHHESAFVIAMGLASADLLASKHSEGVRADERVEFLWTRAA